MIDKNDEIVWVHEKSEWRATDKDGRTFEYEKKPAIFEDSYFASRFGDYVYVGMNENNIKWENSLVKRNRSPSKETQGTVEQVMYEISVFENPTVKTATKLVEEYKKLKKDYEFLKRRNTELFSELEKVKKVANDLAFKLTEEK